MKPRKRHVLVPGHTALGLLSQICPGVEGSLQLGNNQSNHFYSILLEGAENWSRAPVGYGHLFPGLSRHSERHVSVTLHHTLGYLQVVPTLLLHP